MLSHMPQELKESKPFLIHLEPIWVDCFDWGYVVFNLITILLILRFFFK